MPEPTVIELVDGVIDLLSDPERWTQGLLFRTADGKPIERDENGPVPFDAAKFCLWGGLIKVWCDATGSSVGRARYEFGSSMVRVRESLGTCILEKNDWKQPVSIAGFNDRLPYSPAGHRILMDVLRCTKERLSSS